MKKITLLALIVLTCACTPKTIKPTMGGNTETKTCPPQTTKTCQPQTSSPVQIPSTTPVPQPSANKTPESTAIAPYSLLKSSSWGAFNLLVSDDLTKSWQAWQFSCQTLIHQTKWKSACEQTKTITKPTQAALVNFYTNNFDVFSTTNENGTDEGTITGYYEPMLRGSLTPSEQYPYPLYQAPHDLITVELADLFPELKYKRIRGRLVDDKLVPYYSRAEIETPQSPLTGNEIVWVDDIIDAFFLQIQGSGLVQLNDGTQLHVGYANQNGHPYQSIGKLLVDRGELTLSQASMQGIKQWARTHLNQLRELLNSNPSYVFFRPLPKNLPGPLGALGVPLTAERSVAIDPKYIPLGAPIFLATTYPNSSKPLNQLMMAQDTGGAIKNGVRADFYWGSGDTAGKFAGAMKQTGKIWVLLPKGFFNAN
jgi:membrane-bound lytic murein transglycosylase A